MSDLICLQGPNNKSVYIRVSEVVAISAATEIGKFNEVQGRCRNVWTQGGNSFLILDSAHNMEILLRPVESRSGCSAQVHQPTSTTTPQAHQHTDAAYARNNLLPIRRTREYDRAIGGGVMRALDHLLTGAVPSPPEVVAARRELWRVLDAIGQQDFEGGQEGGTGGTTR